MAVNQSQVDHIITAASEDDPEVKLQNLEREVDLIKTSIKRLLMDIRERMNEMENPFTLVAAAPDGAGGTGDADAQLNDAKKSALEAREAALDARESTLEAAKIKPDDARKKEMPAAVNPEVAVPALLPEDRRIIDEQVLSMLKLQMPAALKSSHAPAPLEKTSSEKFRLQKVYKLFKWTNQAVRKFGHDRLEIIIESYRIMGYIPKESCDEIREISRLMPANLGEEHEVGPDEFVSELYSLNRILVPADTSLDRDMIEVMMEQRQQVQPSEDHPDIPEISLKEGGSGRGNKKTEEWMNLPDRI